MRNKITQTLFGLAGSLVLAISCATVADAKASPLEQDALTIDYGKLDVIRLDDKYIELTADDIKLDDDNRFVINYKIAGDARLIDVDRQINDEIVAIKIADNYVPLVKVDFSQAVDDTSRVADLRLIQLDEFGQVDVKKSYDLKRPINRTIR
ncbi:MAG TPA: hypothetical protein VN282_09905 [Pyrinomonadaceae bacterium]|nr:hypothetical protein [Pyrinomonadaceae bacterium]